MAPPPPEPTRSPTLFPYTPLFRLAPGRHHRTGKLPRACRSSCLDRARLDPAQRCDESRVAHKRHVYDVALRLDARSPCGGGQTTATDPFDRRGSSVEIGRAHV